MVGSFDRARFYAQVIAAGLGDPGLTNVTVDDFVTQFYLFLTNTIVEVNAPLCTVLSEQLNACSNYTLDNNSTLSSLWFIQSACSLGAVAPLDILDVCPGLSASVDQSCSSPTTSSCLDNLSQLISVEIPLDVATGQDGTVKRTLTTRDATNDLQTIIHLQLRAMLQLLVQSQSRIVKSDTQIPRPSNLWTITTRGPQCVSFYYYSTCSLSCPFLPAGQREFGMRSEYFHVSSLSQVDAPYYCNYRPDFGTYYFNLCFSQAYQCNVAAVQTYGLSNFLNLFVARVYTVNALSPLQDCLALCISLAAQTGFNCVAVQMDQFIIADQCLLLTTNPFATTKFNEITVPLGSQRAFFEPLNGYFSSDYL